MSWYTSYVMLGGSSHLVSGLVHPSFLSGLTLYLSHVNHWGYNSQKRFVGSSPPSVFPRFPTASKNKGPGFWATAVMICPSCSALWSDSVTSKRCPPGPASLGKRGTQKKQEKLQLWPELYQLYKYNWNNPFMECIMLIPVIYKCTEIGPFMECIML